MGSDAEIWIVLTGLCLMVGLLIADRLRPGLVLFSIVVLFMCAGIVSPEEVLAGFGNKGVITVALLFLVSEGVRRSDALGHLVERLLPEKKSMTIRRGYARILPTIASVSAFLNNTPFSAPLPTATMIAAGVASPKAQGQAITSTATKTCKANLLPAPANHQLKPATNAITNTTGTNTAAI